MCRSEGAMRRCIATARKETSEVYAVYERWDGVDLIGIVKVHERRTATLCDVDRNGDAYEFETVPNWCRPSNRKVAGMFGLDACYEVRRV